MGKVRGDYWKKVLDATDQRPERYGGEKKRGDIKTERANTEPEAYDTRLVGGYGMVRIPSFCRSYA